MPILGDVLNKEDIQKSYEKLDIDSTKIPKHIAIIMDGNRRWAKENNTQTILGHKKGLDTAREICIYCNENEIKYLTLYAFSIQNATFFKKCVIFSFSFLKYL